MPMGNGRDVCMYELNHLSTTWASRRNILNATTSSGIKREWYEYMDLISPCSTDKTNYSTSLTAQLLQNAIRNRGYTRISVFEGKINSAHSFMDIVRSDQRINIAHT
jgi:hypothetical protein